MSNIAEWEEFRYSTSDGLRLAGRKYGWHHLKTGPTVVCLPGLTRNSADFHELAIALSNEELGNRRVLCLDYRGRGNSEYDKSSDNYTPLVEADDVIQGMVVAGVSEADIIGTSRGGIIAMILAAMRPGMLHSVILNDVGPQLDAKGLVRIKAYMQRSARPENMAQAIENLKEYASTQFPTFGEADWQKQAKLIYQENDGKLSVRYDPALINGLKAINLDAPLPTMWPQFAGLKNIPVMVIRGANSDLLSKETVEQMRQEHSGLKVLNVPNQGHAPDLGTIGIPERIAKFLDEAV
ncbi:MAG: alpha/beta hydrolase [Hyphomicrobiales bacterium]|nr:MAG: alpha/beta hydrolase [Hyphomicrobiales bacterium]